MIQLLQLLRRSSRTATAAAAAAAEPPRPERRDRWTALRPSPGLLRTPPAADTGSSCLSLLLLQLQPPAPSASGSSPAEPCALGVRHHSFPPFYFSSVFPPLSSSSSSSSSSSRPRWILQRVPVVLPQSTESRPAPAFLSPARLEVTSPCDPDCHKRAPPLSYWDLRHLLAYETLYSDGHLTETAIGIYGYKPHSGPVYSSGSSGKAERPRVRRKRQIFGHDGRFNIAGQDFLLKYPFSVAVKLSTGCSGTLVGDHHVLTAAHCVHDGKNYVKGAQKLRVGFLKPKQRDTRPSSFYLPSNFTNYVERDLAPYPPPTTNKMKFQWIRVKRTHVPKGWIKGNANDIGMDYDYALLELKKPHKRRHMKLGVSPPAQKLPGRRVHFSGFDNDRPGQLVYRFCRAGEETSDLLYQHCDAQPGASGSGVYARMWDGRRQRWERKVIGVFSGHQWVERQGASQEFNVAVRITPLKYAQICYWIKGNFVDCREG